MTFSCSPAAVHSTWRPTKTDWGCYTFHIATGVKVWTISCENIPEKYNAEPNCVFIHCFSYKTCRTRWARNWNCSLSYLNHIRIILESYQIVFKFQPREFLGQRWGCQCPICHGTKSFLIAKRFPKRPKTLFDSQPTVAWPPTTVAWPFSDIFQKFFFALNVEKALFDSRPIVA